MWNYNNIYFRPITMDIIEEDGKAWMTLVNRNGICKVDMKTRKAQIYKVFENEPPAKEFIYTHMERVDNYLVFAPGFSDKIAIYNLEKDFITYIPLLNVKKKLKESQKEVKFGNIIRYNSTIYLLGYSYPAIIKLQMKTLTITYINKWVEEIEKNIHMGDSSGYFSNGYIIIDNLILIPVGCMNAILELDLETNHTEIRKLNVTMKGIGGLSSIDGNKVWLVGRGNKTNQLVCWNRNTNKIRTFWLTDIEENLFEPFYAPIFLNNILYLLPLSAPYIYEFDTITEEIKRSKLLERELKEISSLWLNWKILAPRLCGNILKFLECDDFSWYEYNILTKESKKYYIQIEEEKKEKFFDDIISEIYNTCTLPNEAKVPLNYFLNKIVKGGSKKREGINKKCTIGNKIYYQVLYNTSIIC